jgi:hypothetical protein
LRDWMASLSAFELGAAASAASKKAAASSKRLA